jgi:hypothetical protein
VNVHAVFGYSVTGAVHWLPVHYITGLVDVGMKLLMDDGNVFGCFSNIDETIYHSELGSSDAILRAGYNIASFMVLPPVPLTRSAPCL